MGCEPQRVVERGKAGGSCGTDVGKFIRRCSKKRVSAVLGTAAYAAEGVSKGTRFGNSTSRKRHHDSGGESSKEGL